MTRKEKLERTIDFDDAILRIVRLEKENAKLKDMVKEMYFLLRNYDKFFIGDRLLKCFETFLKDSEVDK